MFLHCFSCVFFSAVNWLFMIYRNKAFNEQLIYSYEQSHRIAITIDLPNYIVTRVPNTSCVWWIMYFRYEIHCNLSYHIYPPLLLSSERCHNRNESNRNRIIICHTLTRYQIDRWQLRGWKSSRSILPRSYLNVSFSFYTLR